MFVCVCLRVCVSVCVCVFANGGIRGLGTCVCETFTVEVGTLVDLGTYTQVPTFLSHFSSF